MENHPTIFDKSDVFAMQFTLERHSPLHAKGRVHVSDIITVSFDDVDETFFVHNPDGSPEWTGVHKDRNTAILLYLQRRLGIAEGVEEGNG